MSPGFSGSDPASCYCTWENTERWLQCPSSVTHMGNQDGVPFPSSHLLTEAFGGVSHWIKDFILFLRLSRYPSFFKQIKCFRKII